MELLTSLLTGTKLEWIIATLMIAGFSTIVYNCTRDHIMGRGAPDKWGWGTFPFWFLAWLYPDTAIYACILAIIWLSYKRRGNTKG